MRTCCPAQDKDIPADLKVSTVWTNAESLWIKHPVLDDESRGQCERSGQYGSE